ncbi:MAG: energy-coupled thiamine transporter ThiT [Clostridia bacterium]|nr:energy-coupled thiamine transporter ThiT [Clostridia bacterium]
MEKPKSSSAIQTGIKSKRSKKTERLVETAIMIALAFALSMVSDLVPFLQLPFGGKVTLVSCLPLVYIGVRYGLGQGLLAGIITGVIQLVLGLAKNASSLMLEHWYETVFMLLLDYIVAYTAIGLSGILRKSKRGPIKLAFGSIIGLTARYISHIFSGWIFFGQWAEWFFEDAAETYPGTWYASLSESILSKFSGSGLALVYSTVYNGLYMIPEIIVTAVVGAIIGAVPFIARRVRGEDLA